MDDEKMAFLFWGTICFFSGLNTTSSNNGLNNGLNTTSSNKCKFQFWWIKHFKDVWDFLRPI